MLRVELTPRKWAVVAFLLGLGLFLATFQPEGWLLFFQAVVGVGLAFFVDGLDLTVHTTGHAEEETRLPVLAAVGERRRRRGAAPGRDEDAA